ncbi:MAG TPA: MFS transporter [Vicinamibacterales bacterium]|nr:MFS transporter [Vicinamibacterales bacterium]
MSRSVTRVRYRVVALVTGLGMITYLDRACIATLAPGIIRDLGLSTVQMGYAFTAFQLAYAVFEIPTAWWADRRGTRSVLSRIVLWWSALTAATAAAFTYPMLLAIRFLFGMGEAGAWPCVARTFARWIPIRERGRVQGVFFAGAHLVGGLTPALVLWLLTFMSWRAIFVMFGTVGLVWVAIWHTWFRNDPSEHPSVSAAELQTIVAERPPDSGHAAGWEYWGRLIRNRNMLAMCVMYVPNCMIFYFCITWLPTYLKQRHGFDAASLGIFAGLPLIVSMPGDLLGGLVTDRLAARYGLRIGRCGLGAVAYVIAGIALLGAAGSSTPVFAATLIALATGMTMFTLGAAWGTVIELGRNHVGVVGATMNSVGNLAAMLNPLIVAYSVQWFNNWNLPLYLMGSLFLLGALCWLLVDPEQPVFGDVPVAAPTGARTRVGAATA